MICPKCNEWIYFYPKNKCKCKPFTVINEDGDAYAVQAADEEAAALAYAERSNEENDYYLMNESVVITINGKQFKISAEPDVHYSAREVGEK